MKKCVLCTEVKELDKFYKNTGMKDGYLSTCISCMKPKMRNYYVTRGKELKKNKNFPPAKESTCTRCKETKPAEAFSLEKTRTNGLYPWCKVCRQEAGPAHRKKNRAAALAYNQRADVKLRRRERDYAKKYGMSLDDYEHMCAKQEKKCLICFFPPKEGKLLMVDHNHKTGEVRGLLCDTCNRTLGLFKDSIPMLTRALTYLQEKGTYGAS